MNVTQFMALTCFLYACPLIPAVIACTKVGQSFVPYWIAEIVIGFIVPASTFYLQAIGTSNGLIDSGVFTKPGAEAMQMWDPTRYLILFAGLSLGIWFIVKSIGTTSNRSFNKQQRFFGVFCIAYGLAVPQLMNNFLAAVRDANLLK